MGAKRTGWLRWALPPVAVFVLAVGAYEAVRPHPASPPVRVPGGATPTPPDRTILVPWIDISPPPVGVTTSPTVRLCGARDMTVGDVVPVSGQVHRYLALVINRSGTPCRLPGLVGPAGHTRFDTGIQLYRGGGPIAASEAAFTGAGAEDVLMGPAVGNKPPPGAAALIHFGLACSTVTPDAAVISWPGGGTTRVSIAAPPQSDSCSADPTIDGFFETTKMGNVPAPSSLLSARIVSVGQPGVDGRLRYVVRVESFSDSDIALDPCPVYTQAVFPSYSGRPERVEKYLLNCMPFPAVPARSSVDFEMFVTVPSGLLHTDLTVEWSLDLAVGVVTTVSAVPASR
jgi:hypothetical protein